MEQDTVNNIKKELISNEVKLEESMAHTKEISKLIRVIEKAIEAKENEIVGLKSRLSMTKDTLGKTEKDLADSKTCNRKRNDDIDQLTAQLGSERAEVRGLRAQLETAGKQLAALQADLSDTRATAWRRKEEIDTLQDQASGGQHSLQSYLLITFYIWSGFIGESSGDNSEGESKQQGEDHQGA